MNRTAMKVPFSEKNRSQTNEATYFKDFENKIALQPFLEILFEVSKDK